MIEQRIKNRDRRSWEVNPEFPLVDSSGSLISEDRRTLVERRGYSNIEVISFEEIELEVVAGNAINHKM